MHEHDVRGVHIRNKYIIALCTFSMHVEDLVRGRISQFFVLHVLSGTIIMHSSSEKFTWTSTLKAIIIKSFTDVTVPRVIIPQVIREIFLLLFTSSILEHIVQQKNQYAQEYLGERFSTWQLVTVEKLCTYIGFMILMD